MAAALPARGELRPVVNSTFSDNPAGEGGGVYVQSGTATVTNSTISGNTSSYSIGGGVYVLSTGTLNLNNSIVANSTGGDCYNTSTINARHSLIEDGLACVNGTNTNNLTGDPTLNSDLTLKNTSPAINAGDNSLISGYSTDLAGAARIQQGTVDLGAYESPYNALRAKRDYQPGQRECQRRQ